MPQKDLEKRREYQREYQKKWREENPEKVKEINHKHNDLHHERRLAQKRERYAENAEEIRKKALLKYDSEKAAEYYKANKELISERHKRYRQANPEKMRLRSKKWFDENKERKQELGKIWREVNKESIDAKRRVRHWKLKLEVWENYGGAKCSCCGVSEREFLTIDHINGGGGKHRKELRTSGSQHIYPWLKKNNYPEGFRVLCMNCNFSFGMYGFCPHEAN